MIRRALLSVSDKAGIEAFAKALEKKGIEILSTGGTAKILSDAKIKVTKVEDVTKFPECFSGRVKTMHPLVLGGILFRRNDPSHVAEAAKLGIDPIDLVVVSLYPFSETVKKGVSWEETIEQIDVGGPTMLRSSAKNCESVTVVCDPMDYDRVLEQIEKSGDTTSEFRKELAAKAFRHTASYDALITEYVSGGKNRGLLLRDGRDLRYGENPHQWGKFYEVLSSSAASAASRIEKPLHSPLGLQPRGSVEESFTVHQGKELSYLNILDADAAWCLTQEFSEPTAACVKHANPSGVASHADIAEAFQRAYDTDRLSAFGVIIAMNRPCTEIIAKKILDQQIFVEVIAAPGYEERALTLLRQKPKVRVLELPATSYLPVRQAGQLPADTYRTAFGGMLVQNGDTRVIAASDLTCVTKRKPSDEQMRDLLFAWKVVKHAKSNAIVFAKDQISVGIGCGQTSRVDATYLAAKRARERAQNAVMASDAFFPFSDAIEEAARHGITAIIQPGGSVKDAEVIAKADELRLAMVTTGVRAFRH